MTRVICFTGNFLLLTTFIISLIAVFFNVDAINGYNWRYIAGYNSSFGFQNITNSKFLDQDNETKKILEVTVHIYYIGFSFQIIGSLNILAILLISSLSSNLAKNWNLYVIFCSTACTFYTLGIFILIVTMIVFVSRVVYEGCIEDKLRNVHFYEVGFKSSSLLASLSSVFFSLIVNGLSFFALSYSSSTTDHTKTPENSSMELSTRISKKDFSSSRLSNAVNSSIGSTLPAEPPPPPPPRTSNHKNLIDFYRKF